MKTIITLLLFVASLGFGQSAVDYRDQGYAFSYPFVKMGTWQQNLAGVQIENYMRTLTNQVETQENQQPSINEILMSAANRNQKQQHRINQYKLKWQKVFRMEDWDILIFAVPSQLMYLVHQEHVEGLSWWNVRDKSGVIFVMDENDYKTPAMQGLILNAKGKKVNIKSDQENTVVHEMIHNVVEHMKNEYAVRTLADKISPIK